MKGWEQCPSDVWIMKSRKFFTFIIAGSRKMASLPPAASSKLLSIYWVGWVGINRGAGNIRRIEEGSYKLL